MLRLEREALASVLRLGNGPCTRSMPLVYSFICEIEVRAK